MSVRKVTISVEGDGQIVSVPVRFEAKPRLYADDVVVHRLDFGGKNVVVVSRRQRDVGMEAEPAERHSLGIQLRPGGGLNADILRHVPDAHIALIVLGDGGPEREQQGEGER